MTKYGDKTGDSLSEEKNALGKQGANREHRVPDASDVITYSYGRNTISVGQVFNHNGYLALEWIQEPLRIESKKYEEAYGMSEGVYKKLKSKNITYLTLAHKRKIFHIDSYDKKIPKDYHKFNNTKSEPQYIYYV